MREIKFRGKRVDNGEWVYGYFVKAWDGTCYIITEFGSDVTCCSDCGCNDMTVHEVDPDTVGQYTGLHDKNGKEIYEGDIVGICEADDMDWRIYQVKYHGDRDYPAFDIEPSIDCDCNGLSYAVACCEIEVIGNVFENPELLGVAK